MLSKLKANIYKATTTTKKLLLIEVKVRIGKIPYIQPAVDSSGVSHRKLLVYTMVKQTLTPTYPKSQYSDMRIYLFYKINILIDMFLITFCFQKTLKKIRNQKKSVKKSLALKARLMKIPKNNVRNKSTK